MAKALKMGPGTWDRKPLKKDRRGWDGDGGWGRISAFIVVISVFLAELQHLLFLVFFDELKLCFLFFGKDVWFVSGTVFRLRLER